MSRLGRHNSYSCSPVAGLITMAALLLAVVASADATPRGLDNLAGPLRDIALDNGRDVATTPGVTVLPDGLLQVQLQFDDQRAALCTDLGPYGAQVQFRRDVRVQASVPADKLLTIASLPHVVQVRTPSTPVACQGYGSVYSEGVQFTNASAMHTAGFTGTGTRVAILDLGFAGASGSAEVPTPEDTVSFRADGSTSASAHGTAVAEHVADMAPGASLTLIAVDTGLSIENAIDYVIAEGFEIAVMALVILDGPFDGTHPVARAVDRAAAAGVLWIQAAGNHAERHWAGTFTDNDGDGINEYASGVEDLSIIVTGAGFITMYLSWFESAGAVTSQDYDLILRDASGNFIAQSAHGQNGSQPPRDPLIAYVPAADTYSLQIVRISGDVAQNDTFKLFVPSASITASLQVPESSIGTPAEAPGALTVGATRGTDVDITPYSLAVLGIDEIEAFSSQGPALSGLLKPDMVAPDGCRTSFAEVGTAVFDSDYLDYTGAHAFGTSFAAAHAAGAAALLHSEDNSRTCAELEDAIRSLLIEVPPPPPIDPPLPNNIYGNGRVSLRTGTDWAKPVAVITYPRSGDTISTMEPVVTAYLSDEGTGIDPASIVVQVDDVPVTGWAFNAITGVLTFVCSPPNHDPLTRTAHRISLDVADLAGNDANQAISSFRVAPPAISAGLHMISIPFTDLADLNPGVIFGLPEDQVTVVRWLPTDTTPTTKYHWWGGAAGIRDEFASFEPQDTKEEPYVVAEPPAGLGYFLSIPTAATLNVSGRSLSDHIDYQVKLSAGSTQPRGWNMIGCPYPDGVTWGGVQFITEGVRQDLLDAIEDGVTEGILFELKRAGSTMYYDFPSDPLAGSVQPWKAYWVHVLKDTTLVMYNSVISAGASEGPKSPRPATPTADNWTLRFGASVSGGQDPANYIGVSSKATDGYDAGIDAPEPPALSIPVSVYMSRAEWGERSGHYAKDVRGAVGVGQEWDVTVECTQPGADVTVTWPGLNAEVPADTCLVLRDVDAGRDVFMRTTAGYTYRSAADSGLRRLKIVATPVGEGAILLTGVTTAQAADGTVQLTYSVNNPAEVSAEIVNISGRTIQKLGAKWTAPGHIETLAWNCRNAHGAKVPAGRYIVRLTARTENGRVANAVRALQVGR